MRLTLFILIVLFIIIPVCLLVVIHQDDLAQKETQRLEGVAQLMRLLKAAEAGDANYIIYTAQDVDPFSREQQLEYFAACGYRVVGWDRDGGFIVERIDWRETESPPEEKTDG